MRIFDSFTHELMRNCCSACIDVEKTASIFGFPLRLTTQHYNSNKSTWPEVTREGSPSRPSRKMIKVVPEVRDRVKNALYMFRNAEWGNKSKWSLYTPDYYLPDSMIGLLSNHYPEILSLNDLTLVLQKLGQVEDLPCHSSLLSIYQIINRVIELNSDLLQNNPGTTMASKSTEREPMSDASWELPEYFVPPGDNSPTTSQIMREISLSPRARRLEADPAPSSPTGSFRWRQIMTPETQRQSLSTPKRRRRTSITEPMMVNETMAHSNNVNIQDSIHLKQKRQRKGDTSTGSPLRMELQSLPPELAQWEPQGRSKIFEDVALSNYVPNSDPETPTPAPMRRRS